jgi:hypothetical protein
MQDCRRTPSPRSRVTGGSGAGAACGTRTRAEALAWTKVYGIGEWDALAAAAGDATSLFVCWPYRGKENRWVATETWERLALITDGPSGGDRENDRLYQLLDSRWRLDGEIAIPRWPLVFDKLMLWSRP